MADLKEFLQVFTEGKVVRDSYPASRMYNQLYRIVSTDHEGIFIQPLDKHGNLDEITLFVRLDELIGLMYKLSETGTILYGREPSSIERLLPRLIRREWIGI